MAARASSTHSPVRIAPPTSHSAEIAHLPIEPPHSRTQPTRRGGPQSGGVSQELGQSAASQPAGRRRSLASSTESSRLTGLNQAALDALVPTQRLEEDVSACTNTFCVTARLGRVGEGGWAGAAGCMLLPAC